MLAHARALLTSTAEGATAYLDADLHDTSAILADAASTLDFSRPVALLSSLAGGVALDVRDDGQGFVPAAVSDGGFGLIAMRQRIEEQAGLLLIESEPGGGTAISARLPAGPAPAPAVTAEVTA